MRCSAWSSRSTWVCSLAVAAALWHPTALGAAASRLTIDPPSIAPGARVELAVAVPNTNDRLAVNHVTIGIPQDFLLEDAEAKTGWKQSRTGQAVTWWGGSIPVGEFARFDVRGTAPLRAETVLFNVVIGDRTGKSSTYNVPLEVVPPANDDNARSLAKAALVVAIVGGVIALAAAFVGLSVWLRRPPP
jgi:uncharacterized protein YcnI